MGACLGQEALIATVLRLSLAAMGAFSQLEQRLWGFRSSRSRAATCTAAYAA
jgi:hypothetical protein